MLSILQELVIFSVELICNSVGCCWPWATFAASWGCSCAASPMEDTHQPQLLQSTFGQAGKNHLGDCVILVLYSKLDPEIRQSNTSYTAQLQFRFWYVSTQADKWVPTPLDFCSSPSGLLYMRQVHYQKETKEESSKESLNQQVVSTSMSRTSQRLSQKTSRGCCSLSCGNKAWWLVISACRVIPCFFTPGSFRCFKR